MRASRSNNVTHARLPVAAGPAVLRQREHSLSGHGSSAYEVAPKLLMRSWILRVAPLGFGTKTNQDSLC